MLIVAASAASAGWSGKALYSEYCKGCHGTDGVARVGGTVPDLRYANADTHRTWAGIVVGGARRANGMPPFPLTIDQADSIRAWVLSLAGELRRAGASH